MPSRSVGSVGTVTLENEEVFIFGLPVSQRSVGTVGTVGTVTLKFTLSLRVETVGRMVPVSTKYDQEVFIPGLRVP